MLLKARKFFSLALLALFVSASVAHALPLVWCVGSDGHSAVELKTARGDCEDLARTFGRPEAGQAGDCIDVGLTQVASTVSKPSPVATPASTDNTLLASAYAGPAYRQEPLSIRWLLTASIPGQLDQLRTVVLNI